MLVIGLDPSVTAFGVASTAAPDPWVLTPPKTVNRGWLRLDWLYRQVMDICEGADLVVREGYAYHSATNAVTAGELMGIIGYALWRRRTPMVSIAPNTLKKLATGVGKGKKNGVLVGAVKRLGYRGSDDNEADALWLVEAARQWYDLPGKVTLPKAHTETLGKVKWPAIEKLRASA